MKAIKSVFAAISAAVILFGVTSCQKTDLEAMSGSYTYKISGTVGLVPTQLIGTGTPLDTTWVALYPEQGQMNIVTKDADKSIMIVTWNDITGNASSAEATIDGSTLTLTPSSKTAVLTDGEDKIGSGIVAFTGGGTKYDNMLLLTLTYRGVFTASKTSMTAVASDVECIAKAN